MIDKRFYEHKEQDPAKSAIGVVLLSLVILLMSLSIGSTVTANELGCPRWLSGAYHANGSWCFAGPAQGLIWTAEYRLFPNAHARHVIASWSKRQRAALTVPTKFFFAGVALSVVLGALIAVGTRRRRRSDRAMHKGTRFWASDEEVFGTGLAVNYRPQLSKRLRQWIRGS